MDTIQDIIEKKALELARKHIKIIDTELKKVCEKFKCLPEDLIIEYSENMQININVKGSHFKINNKFVIADQNLV